jgi:hypothetical protein
MKLLVVGNSQAAALRRAVADSLPPGATGPAHHGPFAVSFYVLPGADGPKLRRDGGRLKPKTADRDALTTVGGAVADGIDPTVFDALLVSAAGLPPDRGRPGHVVTDLTLAERVPDAEAGVSHALFARAMVASYAAGNAWKSITLLRGTFPGPLLVEPWALPTAAVLTRGESAAARRYGPAFFAWYGEAQDAMLTELVARDLPGARLLHRPSAAAGSPGFTADAFRTGDPWHMNGDYGRLVLAEAAAALGL